MGNFPSTSWRIFLPFSLHFVAFAFLWWKHRKALKAGNLIFEKIGHVAGIIFYPVKSCRGISLETANCLIEGLEDDRLVNISFQRLVVGFGVSIPCEIVFSCTNFGTFIRL